MKHVFYTLPILVLPFVIQSAEANLVVTTSTDATALASKLAGSGITVISATLIGSANQQGTFTGGLSSGLAIDLGVILTSGNALLAPGPNNSTSAGEQSGTGGNTQLNALLDPDHFTFDQNVLSFSFTTNTGDLFFDYDFASEEYNEWVNTSYNDVFGFFIDDVNIALVPGTTSPVTIDTINNGVNSALFVDNTGPTYNIQYDGFTKKLTASILGLAAGEHHIDLAIADANDQNYDSAVFLKAGSFTDKKVPEPATMALLGLGFVGFSMVRRRKI